MCQGLNTHTFSSVTVMAFPPSLPFDQHHRANGLGTLQPRLHLKDGSAYRQKGPHRNSCPCI